MKTTPDMLLRLDCLRMAMGQGAEQVRYAQLAYDFVQASPDVQQALKKEKLDKKNK